MGKSTRKSFLALGLTATALNLASCVAPSPFIPETIVTERGVGSSGLITGIEGLGGGYLVHNLVANVAHDVGMVQYASSGDPSSHMVYIEAANRLGNQIFIAGFSSGGKEARMLAEMCKERGIPVKRAFMLDPTYVYRPFPGEIPDNVEKVVCFASDGPALLVGGKMSIENLADPQKTLLENVYIGGCHLDLPQDRRVAEKIEQEILTSRGSVAVDSRNTYCLIIGE
jgi:hypothetical protein